MTTNGKSEPVLTYNKSEFKAGVILPDAPEGEWTATVLRGKTKVQPTKNGDPMVTFLLRLDQAEMEENEHAQGSTLRLRVVFFGDKGGNAVGNRMTKEKLRDLASQAEFDLDIIPSVLNNPPEVTPPDALKPFINMVEGKQLTIWTTHKPNKQTPGVIDTEIHLRRPGSYNNVGTSSRGSSDDDE